MDKDKHSWKVAYKRRPHGTKRYRPTREDHTKENRIARRRRNFRKHIAS
jgi:hypothetical protein